MWSKTVGLIAVLAGALFAWPDNSPDGWRMPGPVVTEEQYNQSMGDLDAVYDSVFLVWIDWRNSPPSVGFKTSTNVGFTWGNESTIPRSGGANDHLAIALDKRPGSGWTYVIWDSLENNLYSMMFSRSSDRGQTWSTTHVPGATDRRVDLAGSICVDLNGNLHIAYYYYEPDDPWEHKVYYIYSADNGANWTNPELVYMVGRSDEIIEQTVVTTMVVGEAVQPQVSFQKSANSYVCFAFKDGAGWTVFENWTMVSENPHSHCMAPDQSGDLHYFSKSMFSINHIPKIIYRRGHWDGYWTWTDPETLDYTGSVNHPDVDIHGDSIDLVYEKTGGGWYYDIYHLGSRDRGQTWSAPIRITQRYEASLSYHPSIAAGRISRYVCFTSHKDDVELQDDIWCLTNDDSLLSDDDGATAVTTARHLDLSGWSDLYLTYRSQGMLNYTSSGDGGVTWSPFHKFAAGWLPSLGQGWTMVFEPYIGFTYIEETPYGLALRYVRYSLATGTWSDPIYLMSQWHDNLWPGAASLVANMDQVYVIVPVYNYEMNQQYNWTSAVYFYQFDNNLQNSYPPSVHLDSTNYQIGNACLALDGDAQVYGVWEKYNDVTGYTTVWSRYRDVGQPPAWHPALNQAPENVSDQTPPNPIRNSYTPFIETWPSYAYCVWSREEADGEPATRDIWRRAKNTVTQNWDPMLPYSNQGDGLASDGPTNASGDCSVWQQPNFMDFNNDMWFRSDAHGGPNNLTWTFFVEERNGHSQMARFGWPDMLYATFTKENAVPYRVITLGQPLLDNFGEAGLYYEVKTGDSIPSSYCLKRDSRIRYENYKVDYGQSELIYNLHYLDPHHIYGYRMKATLYFEGTGTKSLKLRLDGTDRAQIKLLAGQPFTFEAEIPRALYSNDRKIVLSVSNEAGLGAYMAGLKVYLNKPEKTGRGGQGGVQSAEVTERSALAQLNVVPNPASGTVRVAYSVTNPGQVKIRVFDASGRLIRVLDDKAITAGKHSLSWDLRDHANHRVSRGVYFLRLESDTEIRTKKLIVVK